MKTILFLETKKKTKKQNKTKNKTKKNKQTLVKLKLKGFLESWLDGVLLAQIHKGTSH